MLYCNCNPHLRVVFLCGGFRRLTPNGHASNGRIPTGVFVAAFLKPFHPLYRNLRSLFLSRPHVGTPWRPQSDNPVKFQ